MQYGWDLGKVHIKSVRTMGLCEGCGITSHVPTTQKRGGISDKGARNAGYPRERSIVRKDS